MVHLSETGWYTDEMVECLESVAKLLDISYDDVVKRLRAAPLPWRLLARFHGFDDRTVRGAALHEDRAGGR